MQKSRNWETKEMEANCNSTYINLFYVPSAHVNIYEEGRNVSPGPNTSLGQKKAKH